jgi:hypothetical protein
MKCQRAASFDNEVSCFLAMKVDPLGALQRWESTCSPVPWRSRIVQDTPRSHVRCLIDAEGLGPGPPQVRGHNGPCGPTTPRIDQVAPLLLLSCPLFGFFRTFDDGGCRNGGPDWLCVRHTPACSAGSEVAVSPALPETWVTQPPTPIIKSAGEPT